MSAPDIFLSYNREDQATAQRFAKALEAEGFSVWWDVTLRSGEAYDQVTEEALKTAKAVVVLWSQKSVVSRWVRAEATLADRNRTLVPARIGPCDLPIMFELTQTADLSHWRGEADDPVWQSFLSDVHRLVGGDAARNRLKPPVSPVSSTPPPNGVGPSIAILPFVNRSGLREDDVFAEGMAEDMTIVLSANPWMRVVPASATAGFRKGARDLQQIGHELRVRYLFEGNVRRTGEVLRVTAQLIDAEEGKIVWSDKFDRPLAELAALEEELVTEVAAHLGVQVELAEVDRALKKSTDSTAWEAFMRATAYYSRATRSGYESAVAEAKRALEIDPNYSLAYGVLVIAQSMLLIYCGENQPELVREMTENVRKARALDPDNPHILSGCAAASMGLLKPLDALPFGERLVTISPNLDYAHSTLGIALVQLGRSDDGLTELDRAYRLAPNTIRNHSDAVWRSVAHLQAGRLDQALESADRAVRLLVSPESLMQNILCLVKANDPEHARAAMRRLRDIDPGISAAHIENLIRFFHLGSSAVDEYIEIAEKIWDQTGGDA